jgi:hypothetical protein
MATRTIERGHAQRGFWLRRALVVLMIWNVSYATVEMFAHLTAQTEQTASAEMPTPAPMPVPTPPAVEEESSETEIPAAFDQGTAKLQPEPVAVPRDPSCTVRPFPLTFIQWIIQIRRIFDEPSAWHNICGYEFYNTAY